MIALYISLVGGCVNVMCVILGLVHYTPAHVKLIWSAT